MFTRFFRFAVTVPYIHILEWIWCHLHLTLSIYSITILCLKAINEHTTHISHWVLCRNLICTYNVVVVLAYLHIHVQLLWLVVTLCSVYSAQMICCILIKTISSLSRWVDQNIEVFLESRFILFLNILWGANSCLSTDDIEDQTRFIQAILNP